MPLACNIHTNGRYHIKLKEKEVGHRLTAKICKHVFLSQIFLWTNKNVPCQNNRCTFHLAVVEIRKKKKKK